MQRVMPPIKFDKNSPENMACIRIPSPVIPRLMVWSVHLTNAKMHIKNASFCTPRDCNREKKKTHSYNKIPT